MKSSYCFISVALFLSQAAWSDNTLSAAAFYVQGEYGNREDTTMSYFPVQWLWRGDRARVAMTTSFLDVDGVDGKGGPLDTNGALPKSGHAEGQGDSYFKASYELRGVSPRLVLRPYAKIKIPTADKHKGLGSGEFDYQAQLESFYFINGWWPYLSVGYRWRGDGNFDMKSANERVCVENDFENGFVYGAGLFRNLSANTSLTLMFEHRDASRDYTSAVEELMATFEYKLDRSWSASATVGTGFTAYSADRIVGMQVAYRF